ncbi:MAG: transposase, partial [Patescibacteria group bacterium]
MRKELFKEKEVYYLHNSSSGNNILFGDEQDFIRFLFLILYFQSPTPIYNSAWYTQMFEKKGSFVSLQKNLGEILRTRAIELLCFNLEKDSFHLLVRNLVDGSASVYMQRVLTAYSKYYNAKYVRRGHVFNGPFIAIKIKNNEALSKASFFTHKR